MQKKRFRAGLTFVLLLCSLSFVIAQAGQPQRSLIVTGHAGELAVVEMGGRSYVEIQALAQLANASLSPNGNQMVLTLPGSSPHTGATASLGSQAASRELMTDRVTEFAVESPQDG